jgi:hypothetical protein
VILKKYAEESAIPDNFDKDLEYIITAESNAFSGVHGIETAYMIPGGDGRLHRIKDVVVRGEIHDVLTVLSAAYIFVDQVYSDRLRPIFDKYPPERALRVEAFQSEGWIADFNGSRYYSCATADYTLPGLDEQLENITPAQSAALYGCLAEIDLRTIYKTAKSNKYIYKNFSSYIGALRESEWLYNMAGERCNPGAATVDFLAPEYYRGHFPLIEYLGFMTADAVRGKVESLLNDKVALELGTLGDGELFAVMKILKDAGPGGILAMLRQAADSEQGGEDEYLSEDERIAAGKRYERTAWEYLTEGFIGRGYTFREITGGLEGECPDMPDIKLLRMDELKENHPAYDFLLETGGERQYIEVKGSLCNDYGLSRLQYHLALKCYYEQKESQYRLLLLDGGGVKMDCDNVISLMSEGKLELTPQQLRIV